MSLANPTAPSQGIARLSLGEASNSACRLSTWQAAALGLALMLSQLLAVLALAPGRSVEARYLSLCQWDGWQYDNIAAQGYHSTVPPVPNDIERSNVGFFPGYPLVAGLLSRACGMTVPAALLLTAQLSSWGFWTYWLLFLDRWRVGTSAALAVTVALLAHPASFYLVVSYSESLFLFGLLGYLFWATSKDRGWWLWSSVHGIVMTATRLAGIPIAICPALAAVACNQEPGARCAPRSARIRRVAGLSLVALAAAWGGLGFFAYCQWRFGAWDLYMQTQKAGWHVSPDWLWWLRPTSYIFWASRRYPSVPWPDDVSRLCTLVTVAVAIAVAIGEYRLARRGDRSLPTRLVFYLPAAALLFVHGAGVSSIVMKSMVRYNLGVYALLLAALAHWSTTPSSARYRRPMKVAIYAICIFLACAQMALAWRFLRGQWVA
jgi:hypothetical protein